MESNENARMSTLSDCLTKYAVFTTSYIENRRYDMQSLADLMSSVEVTKDMQIYIESTLKANPPRKRDHGRRQMSFGGSVFIF